MKVELTREELEILRGSVSWDCGLFNKLSDAMFQEPDIEGVINVLVKNNLVFGENDVVNVTRTTCTVYDVEVVSQYNDVYEHQFFDPDQHMSIKFDSNELKNLMGEFKMIEPRNIEEVRKIAEANTPVADQQPRHEQLAEWYSKIINEKLEAIELYEQLQIRFKTDNRREKSSIERALGLVQEAFSNAGYNITYEYVQTDQPYGVCSVNISLSETIKKYRVI